MKEEYSLLPGVLEELKRQNFGGNISIEYENNWDKNELYDLETYSNEIHNLVDAPEN